MLARSQRQPIDDYASKRVFDGTRPLSKDRVAKLRASYQRTHTTPVVRWVARVSRLFHWKSAHSGC
jgi:hypothetical protein